MDKMNNSTISDQSLMDKSMRSVFVGNIPYEATEENLKDIFSEVGPVLSFKLVFDRETGKPKGYGFCEYKDQETALSAMRNLNGYEIGGRTLRVDNACTEKSRMEMQSLLQGQNTENPYGEVVQADEAPEAISKAVASLPPDQMLELMRQMKQCIQNNPNEARQMLLQNPQLAYALLQAQVVMKIVDPRTAISMLHKSNEVPKVLIPSEKPPAVPLITPRIEDAWIRTRPPLLPQHTTTAINSHTTTIANPPPVPIFANHDVDLRTINRPIDPRVARMSLQTNNLSESVLPMEGIDSSCFSRDPRADRFPRDSVDPRDPRVSIDSKATIKRHSNTPTIVSLPAVGTTTPTGTAIENNSSRLIVGMSPSGNITSGATDQEKAALIMQVLQLSDEQIAMLPSEQRQSILVLKEQIANSTQR